MADDWGLEVTVSSEVPTDFMNYNYYAERANYYKKRAAEEKAKILLRLGYEAGDPKPEPCVAVSPTGHPVGRVTVGTYRNVDLTYLKDKYPQVYAECEKVKPTLIIRMVD